ncbi:hypothetical protein [Neobacillus sp. PS3-40]|uniref:hypothetical protein n=1 Tax=Neobacillus sp. PS3-40 TaxID=3070679 RepID=UPI0027DF72A4|nr:hypothetical protein [Neobacillus sp. PS3-40]WML46207.1 hypothetical protein RCG20_10060 [Neobacillus sp. PS3-40]
MKDNWFLLFPKKVLGIVIIFIGKQPGDNEIQMIEKPGFFDALQLLDEQTPAPMDPPYQFIPLTGLSDETYCYNDPQLSKKINFNFNGNSLQLFGDDQDLTKEAVYNVFNHFLVKKGKKVLFLTEAPKDKMSLKHKGQILVRNEKKKL